jgi:hypothetical protein
VVQWGAGGDLYVAGIVVAVKCQPCWADRRGSLRGFALVVLTVVCLLAAYLLARGDAADMTAAFIRRVRAMGQPE